MAAALLMAGQGGCTKRETPPVSPESTTSTEADPPVEQSNPLVEEEVVFARTQRATEGSDDPQADGWDSEAISNDASQLLNKLGELLSGSDATTDAWMDAGFTSSRLVPESADTAVVFDDDVFMVRRLEHSSDATFGWSKALTDFRTEWQGFHDLHFKFKLFRIGIEGNSIWTRQYFHYSGHDAEVVKEQNSTWLAYWKKDGSDQLKLTRIELEEFEDVISKQPTPLFVDSTSHVLGNCDSYNVCSLTGIGQWRKQLESRLGVLNFGHHGLAIADVNGDLRDDLYVCETGGLPNHLYIQQQDGTLIDVSQASGLNYFDNTRSALFIDLDNDGDQDAVIAFAVGIVLFENNGQGEFAERARFRGIRESFSLSAADMDADGFLDIFVCVYYGTDLTASELPAPVPYFDATNGGKNCLIRNLGNWRFRNVTDQSGLEVDNRRFSYASSWEDFDNDGDQDLLVVNDFGPNQLFRNDGGRFSEVAQQVGLIDGAFGMSASFSDYDRNGYMDLYVANMFSAAGNRVTFQPQFKTEADDGTRSKIQHLARGNALFRNNQGRFEDVSIPAGVTMGRWSWGSLFADINNDGWDDLLVGNGFITGDLPDDL